MAKYLYRVSYTAEGTRGLLKEGGSSRRKTIEKLISELGGKVEVFYYAFGEPDAILIVDLPDATTAAAFSLNVQAAGAVTLSTTPLLTPEDIDGACKKPVSYRAPGT